MPDGLDQRRDVVAGNSAFSRQPQLVGEILVAHRIFGAAARRPLRDPVRPAVSGDDFGRRGRGRKALIAQDLDLSAQSRDFRIIDAGVGKFLDAGFAPDQSGGNRVLRADLRLASGLNLRPVGADGEQRIAGYDNLLDHRHRMGAPPIQHAIKHRMDHEPARIGLIGCAENLPSLTEPLRK